MNLEKNLNQFFCPSPWMHVKISPNGDFNFCRWGLPNEKKYNIRDISVETYFQKIMSSFRMSFLNGEMRPECHSCYEKEKYSKPSGRQRQLLKTGVRLEFFDKSLKSSPWIKEFEKSARNQGHTDLLPVDWQIDLGNYCNSACVFCSPTSSSKIASEYFKLGISKKMPPSNWTDDETLVNNLSRLISSIRKKSYVHFLGGETLIIPAFKKILTSLLESNLNDLVTIGFTTNLTVWPKDVIDLLSNFKNVNAGFSIETMDNLNDYIRYGSKIDEVIYTLHKWIDLSNEKKWIKTLRITPTCLSINRLDKIYEFAIKHKLSVESCNFINEPSFFRPSVLPLKYRTDAIENLKKMIRKYQSEEPKSTMQIVNTRDENIVLQQVIQDAESYVDYLENSPDETHLSKNLITFLKTLESSRNNSIIKYIPEYEEFFRLAGY